MDAGSGSAVTVSDAAHALGISARRVRQLCRLHPQTIASEHPLRVHVAALQQIRSASPAAIASAALHVIETLWPRVSLRTPEVFTLLLIDQMHPELRSARRYPEPLRRLRVRAGLPPDPEGK